MGKYIKQGGYVKKGSGTRINILSALNYAKVGFVVLF